MIEPTGGRNPQAEDEPPSESDRLVLLLESWLARAEEGEAPDLMELCGGDLDLVAQLGALIEREGSLRQALGGAPSIQSAPPVRKLGPYRLLRRLGEGSMGRVFLAEEIPLGRLVAVKILRPHVCSDQRARLRFEREARVTAALEHPNIVPVFAVGQDADHDYMVMKLLDGPGLDRLEGPQDPEWVARLGADMARALHEAHLTGVLHRDVKPANIILDHGTPYLVDFGLAKTRADVTTTRQGAIAGTLLYMSPEQLQGAGIHLDGRTDVYSLGVTLYELLAGQAPFAGSDPESIVHQVLSREPAALRLKGRQHRDLETIVMRAVEKRRRLRFDTALELALDLERYLDGRSIASRPIGPAARLWRRVLRHPRASIAVGASTVLAVVALTLFAVGRGERERARATHAQLIASDLRRGRYEVAEMRLAEHRRRWPDDDEYVRLRERLLGGLGLDGLMHGLLKLPAHRSREQMLDDREALVRHGVHPSRRRWSELVLTMTDLDLGEKARARQRLARLEAGGPTRGTVALSAAVEGRSITEALGEFRGPASARDHLVAAMALHLMGEAATAQEREIESCLLLDPSNRRARMFRGRLHYEAGNYDAAFEAYWGVQPDGKHSTGVRYTLARISLYRGRPAEAVALIETIPPARRNYRHALVEINAAVRRGDSAAAASAVARGLEAYPESADVHLRAAWIARGRGDVDGALEHLERVSQLSPIRSVAFEARHLRLGMELFTLAGGEASPGEIEDLRDDVDDLVADAGSARQKTLAWLLAARVHRRFGRPPQYWQALHAALEAAPDNRMAQYELVSSVAERFLLAHADSATRAAVARRPDRLLSRAAEALNHARSIVGHPSQGLVPLESRVLLDESLFMAAALALAQREIDWPSFRRLSQRFEDTATEGRLKSRRLRNLEDIEAAVRLGRNTAW